MITSEPEVDADDLDDDALLEAYLESATPGAASNQPCAEIPDWPPIRHMDSGVRLDAETLAWFKAHHVDWQTEIRLVLRGWIIAQTRHGQT